MSRMVQVTVAADLTEAEEIQTMLHAAGIPCEVQQAVEHHPTGLEDAPQRVLVEESDLEAAQNAIEALSDPDEFLGDE
jgi:Putative prokaryotic signal transducing protein